MVNLLESIKPIQTHQIWETNNPVGCSQRRFSDTFHQHFVLNEVVFKRKEQSNKKERPKTTLFCSHKSCFCNPDGRSRVLKHVCSIQFV